MDEERLDPLTKTAIVAYFDGFELVEFLQVPTEVIVELLEEYILDNLDDLNEEMGLTNDTEED